MRILDSFTLKVIAIISMTLGHIYVFMNGVDKIDIPIWFGYIGTISAPIFFFLIIEGFFHTKDRGGYLIRIALFGLLMIVVDIVFKISNNIFLSLTLSIILMMELEYCKVRENKYKSIIGIVIVFTLFIFTEASIYGLGMTCIFYFFRNKKLLMCIFYSLFSLFPMITLKAGIDVQDVLGISDFQWMMVFAIPFILMYSGKLGLRNKFIKWMFYIFYPIHLMIIVGISKICF